VLGAGDTVRGRRGEAEPGQEPQHPARAGQRDRDHVGGPDLARLVGQRAEQGVPDTAAAGALGDVDRLQGDRDLVGEQVRTGDPREQQPADGAVQGADQAAGAGLGDQRTDLVPQPLAVVGAELGTHQGLGAGGEAEVDEDVEILRTCRTDGDGRAHWPRPPEVDDSRRRHCRRLLRPPQDRTIIANPAAPA
jgi:hypothetical protein